MVVVRCQVGKSSIGLLGYRRTINRGRSLPPSLGRIGGLGPSLGLVAFSGDAIGEFDVVALML